MRTMLVVFATVNVLIFTYIHIYVCMYVYFEYGLFSNPRVDYTHITTPAMLLFSSLPQVSPWILGETLAFPRRNKER